MRIKFLFIIFIIYSFIQVSKSAPVSIDDLRLNAQAGDPNSQFILAQKYCRGQSVSRDFNEAVKWYSKAAQQGFAKAQYELGVLYEGGIGVPQNFKHAFEWYSKAAQQGYTKAQYSLGLFYSLGLGVGRDYPAAIEWFNKAAHQGYDQAEFSLGLMYFNGRGVEQDYEQAAKWLTKAAVKGNTKAEYYLGVLYCKIKNKDNEIDYKQAAKWFTRAAARGDAKSQYILAAMYCKGQGVPQDYKTAVKWFTKSAAQGFTKSQLVLAACYGDGKGVPQDYVESLKWTLLASLNGDKDAMWLQNEVRDKMTVSQIEEAQKRVNKLRKIKGYVTQKDSNTQPEVPSAVSVEMTSTGFLISPDGFILTAFHSVGKTQSVQVFYNQKEYTAQVIEKNESIDAAVLKIDGNDFSYLPIASSGAVQTGDMVFTMGYPQISLQGTESKFTEGSISSLSGLADNPQYFQISVPVQPGNSGGPLINKNGEVIGLIIARLNDVTSLLSTGSVPQNVNYALKSSYILPFVWKVGDLEKKNSVSDSLQDRPAAIERAKKSIVLVTAYK